MSFHSLQQVPGVAAQAPAETTGFVFNHTMLRVKLLRLRSLEWEIRMRINCCSPRAAGTVSVRILVFT